MKKVITTAMIALFSFAIVGCRASAEVDADRNTGDSSYKKTTTYDRDGSTVKTEKKVETR